MSPTSYQPAPPRDGYSMIADGATNLQSNDVENPPVPPLITTRRHGVTIHSTPTNAVIDDNTPIVNGRPNLAPPATKERTHFTTVFMPIAAPMAARVVAIESSPCPKSVAAESEPPCASASPAAPATITALPLPNTAVAQRAPRRAVVRIAVSTNAGRSAKGCSLRA